MKTIILIFLTVFLFAGCSVTRQNTITLNNKKVVFKKPFEIRSVNSCLDDSFVTFQNHQKYGNLYLEYLRLNTNCLYNGSIYCFFTELFEEELKIKNMEIVEEKEFENIAFYTFKIDDNSFINMIYKYATFEDLIIVDYQGKLSEELIQNYESSYKSKYLNKKRFDKKFNRSLARMNYFNSYFTKDSDIRISR